MRACRQPVVFSCCSSVQLADGGDFSYVGDNTNVLKNERVTQKQRTHTNPHLNLEKCSPFNTPLCISEASVVGAVEAHTDLCRFRA